MEVEFEGHVSSREEEDDGLYESSLILCENESTRTVPIATMGYSHVNCKYKKPCSGSPEALVEAESYTEPDRRDESFAQDTFAVEAYPFVDNNGGNNNIGGKSVTWPAPSEANLPFSSQATEFMNTKQGPYWSHEAEEELKFFLFTGREATTCASSEYISFGDIPVLCQWVEKETNLQTIQLLADLFQLEENTVCIEDIKERILSFPIPQRQDRSHLHFLGERLIQWERNRLISLAKFLQVEYDEKDVNRAVWSILERLNNLGSLKNEGTTTKRRKPGV